jgi:hypothetical protein
MYYKIYDFASSDDKTKIRKSCVFYWAEATFLHHYFS